MTTTDLTVPRFKVLYLNIDSMPDRDLYMRKQLNDLNIYHKRLNGKVFKESKGFQNHRVRGGWHSHQKAVFESIKSTLDEYLLILEDDVKILSIEDINTALDNMKKVEDWDILYLYWGSTLVPERIYNKLDIHAYVINPIKAKYIHELCDSERCLIEASDRNDLSTWMDRFWAKESSSSLKIYGVKTCVIQNREKFNSTLGWGGAGCPVIVELNDGTKLNKLNTPYNLKPIVSWIEPFKEANKDWIKESILSIVRQELPDNNKSELLLIKDGYSSEAVMGTINSLIKEYNKPLSTTTIKLIDPYPDNKDGKGIAMACNIGIKEAKADWIARLDSDDVNCDNKRIIKQLEWANKYNLDIVGSGMFICDRFLQNAKLSFAPDIDTTKENSTIVLNLIKSRICPLFHPTVIMNKAKLLSIGGYKDGYTYAEDMALWAFAAIGGLRIGNIRDMFINHRTHSNQVCCKYNSIQKEGVNRLLIEIDRNR